VRLFLVVDAGVEVADDAAEEKLKFEVWHGGQPLFECALFAITAQARQVVKDEDGAVGQPRAKIVQAIERGR
jgi:hypothetical protein